MASTVSGNAGAANSGAIVSAFKVDGRVNSGVFGAVAAGAPSLATSAVVAANGSFTLGGLAAGTYLLECVLTNNPLGNPGQTKIALSQSTITVDGSSTYNI